MERVRASGGGRMDAPIVVLDACVLYQKKEMMIATKGTSCAMSDKQ